MEPKESSETSSYINTLTPGTYPKEKKLQSKHGESLKSTIWIYLRDYTGMYGQQNIKYFAQKL